MPSKTLMAVWGALDFVLLAASGVSIAFSIIWRGPNLLRNLVLSNVDLNTGLVLGIFYAITFVVSVGAIIQQNHVTIGLAILNWLLIIDAIVTVVCAGSIWFRTLQMTINNERIWNGTTSETRIAIQNLWQCCGFRDGITVEFTGFCSNQTFAMEPDRGCKHDFNKYSDYTQNNVFTTMYGFTAILVCLFICTLCVIKKRQEQDRFRRIDAKRGGRGFV